MAAQPTKVLCASLHSSHLWDPRSPTSPVPWGAAGRPGPVDHHNAARGPPAGAFAPGVGWAMQALVGWSASGCRRAANEGVPAGSCTVCRRACSGRQTAAKVGSECVRVYFAAHRGRTARRRKTSASPGRGWCGLGGLGGKQARSPGAILAADRHSWAGWRADLRRCGRRRAAQSEGLRRQGSDTIMQGGPPQKEAHAQCGQVTAAALETGLPASVSVPPRLLAVDASRFPHHRGSFPQFHARTF